MWPEQRGLSWRAARAAPKEQELPDRPSDLENAARRVAAEPENRPACSAVRCYHQEGQVSSVRPVF